MNGQNCCYLKDNCIILQDFQVFRQQIRHQIRTWIYTWKALAAWNQAFEYIRMHSVTPELREANDSLRNRPSDVRYQDFDFVKTRGGKMCGASHLYRILGHFIFVLDYSALDQVHAFSKFWEGCYGYCVNYRISGTLDSEKSNMVEALDKGMKWIVKAMDSSNFSEFLA